MTPIEPIDPAEIDAARRRIAGLALRTPLVPILLDSGATVHAKLENIQPIGSFKLRGAGNAMGKLPDAALGEGVYTASAGNMAQGVAFVARRKGTSCRVVVPDHAPRAKLEAIARLGAEVVAVPFDRWWQVIEEHAFEGMTGRFIHPVCDPDVIAGNGTIGLEILEDLPEVDEVYVPYGGGGLSVGIASAIHATRPGVRVFGCEVETATPLRAALEAGAPTPVGYTASFVDGIGSRGVLPAMWPLVRDRLAGARVVSLAQIADAIVSLVKYTRTVAEGAGAAALAAASANTRPGSTTVAVISGGNIDTHKLATILQGNVPS